MHRPALLAGAAIFVVGAASPTLAQTVYRCTPDEPRTTAPGRLVSVEITLTQNGEFASVVYSAANGATYDRGKQYESTNGQNAAEHYWAGLLRGNPNVGIVGSFHREADRLVYLETIHDRLHGDKVVAHVTSFCDNGAAGYAAASPPQAAVPSPPVSYPKPEFNAFLDCTDAAAVALATVSSEPAQTIVDAALGECPKQRLALESALERQGVSQSMDFVDGLAKEIRPTLLALVLNARAAAARLGGEPTKSEPAKNQPL